jgi:hypothetical protein
VNERTVKLRRDPEAIADLRRALIREDLSLIGLGAAQVESMPDEELVDRLERALNGAVEAGQLIERAFRNAVVSMAEAFTREAAR